MRPHTKALLPLLMLAVFLAILIQHDNESPQPPALRPAEVAVEAAVAEEPGAAERYHAALERATEAALYNQNRMLDDELSRLQPGDPERIELFLLAIAGDGTQEVFRREVEFIRDQFNRDFNTTDRSLLLVNSRTTTRQLPLATTISIEFALKGLASIMDKDQDILFLYLTSHGSPDHDLALDHIGISLPDLSAERLAEIMGQLPVKWKVIVVSACYSGGFIEPLQDPYTLIITAARHDRQSFGCTDEADMTYFGRAYFQKALPEAGSFVEAFNIARHYISDWEKEFAEESLPQIYAPDEIVRYLDHWVRDNPNTASQTAKDRAGN